LDVPAQHNSNSEGPFARCRGLSVATTKAPSTDVYSSNDSSAWRLYCAGKQV